MKAHGSRSLQLGGVLVGFVVGILIGLATALAVALYVTKAPNPFVNKVPARSPTQDAAEAERNRNWDPNSPLAGRNPASGASASGVVTSSDPPVRPALVPPPAIEPAAPAAPSLALDARSVMTGRAAAGDGGNVKSQGSTRVASDMRLRTFSCATMVAPASCSQWLPSV